MCEWDWATILTIVGAVLELAGLGFVFAELAFIRSYEFGIPPPWQQAHHMVRRLFQRPVTVEGAAVGGSLALGVEAHGVARPGSLTAEPSDRERIERLERYVEYIARDLSAMSRTMRKYRDAAIEEATRRDEAIQQEFERREEHRKTKLKPSLRRQKWGALLIVAGLAIGTIGNVI